MPARQRDRDRESERERDAAHSCFRYSENHRMEADLFDENNNYKITGHGPLTFPVHCPYFISIHPPFCASEILHSIEITTLTLYATGCRIASASAHTHFDNTISIIAPGRRTSGQHKRTIETRPTPGRVRRTAHTHTPTHTCGAHTTSSFGMRSAYGAIVRALVVHWHTLDTAGCHRGNGCVRSQHHYLLHATGCGLPYNAGDTN